MQKFCYRCGALEEEKGPLIDGECFECFLEENPLVRAPEELDLKICRSCGAYFHQNSWHDIQSAEEYLDAAKELVYSEIEVLQKDETGVRYIGIGESRGVDVGFQAEYSSPESVSVEASVNNNSFGSRREPLRDEISVEVNFVEERCEVCSRRASGYYEAILQVRGRGELSKGMKSEILRLLADETTRLHERNRSKFVAKIKRKHGGMDLYTSTTKLARELARLIKRTYDAEIDESAELMGMTDDGEENYRVTVVTRLPD